MGESPFLEKIVEAQLAEGEERAQLCGLAAEPVFEGEILRADSLDQSLRDAELQAVQDQPLRVDVEICREERDALVGQFKRRVLQGPGEVTAALVDRSFEVGGPIQMLQGVSARQPDVDEEIVCGHVAVEFNAELAVLVHAKLDVEVHELDVAGDAAAEVGRSLLPTQEVGEPLVERDALGIDGDRDTCFVGLGLDLA